MLLSDEGPVTTLAEYRKRGGLQGWARAQEVAPQELIDAIRVAGLRGRGGAGFPTAIKLQGALDAPAHRKFAVCNAAEGEPGTFKDRLLMRHNPYLILEGLAITAQAIGAERAYIATKARFTREAAGLERAIAELAAETSIGDRIELVRGPDEYLFGEEKALLAVVEGGLPLPRVFPPYIHGLFAGAYGGPNDHENNPTVASNAETMAHITNIATYGPDWFRSQGTESSPGTTIFTVSGDVKQPTVVELPYGLTLHQLIYDHAGGPRDQRVKAVLAGTASEVITADLLDTAIDFDAMKSAGVGVGSGGFIVYDETACMVQVARDFSHFLYVESCNQCPSCKIGSHKITAHLDDVLAGTASRHDVEEIHQVAGWVTGGHRCALPVSEQMLMYSIVERFQKDFLAHLDGTCRLRHDMPLPKLVDYEPGRGFVYDEHYDEKRADWTYRPAPHPREHAHV